MELKLDGPEKDRPDEPYWELVNVGQAKKPGTCATDGRPIARGQMRKAWTRMPSRETAYTCNRKKCDL